jgi:3-deoxy-D-manno-octulosonate 8-phosphate phosphatase (KDO 8-P phosphatase)
MPLPLAEIEDRARRISLLLMDCDGVLTDGSVIYTADGEQAHEQTKVFHIHDGQGLRLAKQAGLQLGLISGRNSVAVAVRARELGFDYVFQGVADKLAIYEELCQSAQFDHSDIAYIGDDLPDLPLLRRVGLAIAVADAVPEVHTQAHFITQKPGGRGAVREAIEMLLKAQEKWDTVMWRYLN